MKIIDPNIPLPGFLCRVALVLLIAGSSQAASAGSMQTVPQLEGRFLNMDDGHVYIQEAGQGDSIILLHDGLLHSRSWDEPFTFLSEYFRVVRYDRRGYGRSDKPDRPYSNIGDLATIMDQLGIREVHLIGSSSGSSVALDFTLAFPERVRSLILVGPVVRGLGFTRHFYTRGGHQSSYDRGSPEPFRDYWFSKDPYIMGPDSSEAKKKAGAMLSSNPHNLDAGNQRLLEQPDTLTVDHLHEIKVPVLILAGEYDMPDVHAHAGALESGISDAERRVVSNAGHLLHMEQPLEFNRVATRFLLDATVRRLITDQGVEPLKKRVTAEQDKVPGIPMMTEHLLIRLGKELSGEGDVQKAVELLSYGVELFPESPDLYLLLGQTCLENHQREDAEKAFRRVLELDPMDFEASEALEQLDKDR